MANRTIRTLKKRTAFLASLGRGASIAKAAKAAGLSRNAAYVWKHEDEKFSAEWDAAVETGTDLLEDTAVRRAQKGSDTLLIFMLKARRPEKFRERFELTGKDGAPLEVVVTFK